MKKRNSLFGWIKWRKKKKPVIIVNPISQEEKKEKNLPDAKPKDTVINTVLVDDHNSKENSSKTPHTKEEKKGVFSSPTLKKEEESKIKKLNEEKSEKIINNEEIKDKEATIEIAQEEKKENNISIEDINHDTVNVISDDETSIQSDALYELDKLLKNSYYEISRIKYELDDMEEREQEELDNGELDVLIEELNQLIKKFEKIKKDFFAKYPSSILNYPKHNNYMNHLLKEYKVLSNTSNEKDAMILQMKQLEEYIVIIDEIIKVTNRTEHLNDKLENKKEDLKLGEKEFEYFEKDYNNANQINQYVNSFCKTQETIIKEIEAKVNASETITKSVEYKSELVINYTKLLASTLFMATSQLIPPTRGGNLLKMGLMIAAIGNLANVVNVQTKEAKSETKISFIDYETNIRKNLNDVDNMSLIVDKAIMDIRNLKKTFVHDLGNYAKTISGFDDMMYKLDTIEKDLLVKSDIAKKFNEKLNQTLEKNNRKVKKLEEEYHN